MSSLFTKIVKGEIPSYKVAENEYCYAFLDINPLTKGHTLVIPKKEIDYIFDIEDDLYLELHSFAKKVALAIEKVVPCKRVGVAVLGLEVPHAHIHLVPLVKEDDINFFKPKMQLEATEMTALANKIAGAFNS